MSRPRQGIGSCSVRTTATFPPDYASVLLGEAERHGADVVAAPWLERPCKCTSSGSRVRAGGGSVRRRSRYASEHVSGRAVCERRSFRHWHSFAVRSSTMSASSRGSAVTRIARRRTSSFPRPIRVRLLADALDGVVPSVALAGGQRTSSPALRVLGLAQQSAVPAATWAVASRTRLYRVSARLPARLRDAPLGKSCAQACSSAGGFAVSTRRPLHSKRPRIHHRAARVPRRGVLRAGGRRRTRTARFLPAPTQGDPLRRRACRQRRRRDLSLDCVPRDPGDSLRSSSR